MNIKKTTQKQIQQQNLGLILKYILEYEKITRIYLSKITSLAKSTISELTNFLIKNNVIFEYKKLDTKIGKKPTILKFNNNFCYQIAISINIENIYATVADIFGNKLTNIVIKNNPKQNREQILKNIYSAIDKVIRKSNIDYSKIYLISVSTHGVVNPESKIISNAPFLKGWDGIHLEKILNEKYNKKVLIDKDANLGAIGEHWLNFNNIKNLVFIELDYGVGSGIIIDNEIVTGKNGRMGEIGYIPILTYDKGSKNSSNMQFLENLINKKEIIKEVSEYIFKENHLNKNNLSFKKKNINFKDICNYYKQKTPNAIKEIIDNSIIKTISIGLTSLISIVDTEIILLSGEITELGEVFLKKLREQTYEISSFKPIIEISKLGHTAPLEGAIKKGIDYLRKELYSNFSTFFSQY